MDSPPHPPQEHERVQLGPARIAESPPRSPSAENVDDSLKLPAGLCEVVLGHAALHGTPLDQA